MPLPPQKLPEALQPLAQRAEDPACEPAAPNGVEHCAQEATRSAASEEAMPSMLAIVAGQRDGRGQLRERAGDLEKVDNFCKVATSQFQILLSSLITEHQSCISALQLEIQCLRARMSEAEDNLRTTPADTLEKLRLQGCSVSPGVEQSQGDIVEVERQSDVSNRLIINGSMVIQEVEKGSGYNAEGIVKHDHSQKKQMELLKQHTELKKMHRFEESKSTTWWVRRFVHSNVFEIGSAAVIVANTIVMCFEMQYDGLGSGHAVLPADYTEPADRAWPGAAITFMILNIVFNAIFASELVLRMLAHGLECRRMPWMWFDTIIVGAGLLDAASGDASIGIDPTMIRLVRLVRLLRLLELFEEMKSFDSLFLLLKSIRASIHALFWSFLLLVTVQVGAALFLCQMLHGFINDKGGDQKAKEDVFRFFGTFYRAMLTMFEITLANWVPSCRLLVEEVHELYFLFYLVYRCMFCFSVLKVVAAVFISETNRVLSSDTQLTLMKANREKNNYKRKLQTIFKRLDADGDLQITWQEMQVFLSSAELSEWLSTVGLNRTDFEKLFWLIERNGSVDSENFFSRVGQLQGHAKTVDLLNLFKVIHKLDEKFDKTFKLESDAEDAALFALGEGRDMVTNDR